MSNSVVVKVSFDDTSFSRETKKWEKNILSSVGTVMHKKKLNVPGVVNEESLMTRRHHMSGLLVVPITDL